MGVRVRYAPSPTGYQHIGGVRTALFNFLFARSQGGTFVLRIEDTDRERYTEHALQDIYDTFSWLGIHWDEGPDVGGPFSPYFQSERKEIYRQYAEQLVASEHAYRCYCSPERLEELRKQQQKNRQAQGYDRHCRSLTAEEREKRAREGSPYVIRLKIPLSGSTSFHDQILGDISRSNQDINPDPVLLKSDGFPTYHLANVIDDHLMRITHILRGQEWIPTVSVHVILYEAFGWTPPEYYHLPMVLGSDGQKLSKRHGSTRIIDFRREGYLPEALINYISLLGWSHDESREFFTLEELQQLFSQEKLNKAPSVFDYKKLQWFNGVYIRKKTDRDLEDLIKPYLLEDGLIEEQPTEREKELLRGVIPLVKERLRMISEAPSLVRFLFREVGSYDRDSLIPRRLDREKTREVLEQVGGSLNHFESLSEEQREQRFRDMAEEKGIKLGDLLMPLRVALTGSRVSLPLFESIRLLGVQKTQQRIRKALKALE
jgi:glutamyl-tRNA synthetase